MRKAVEAIFYDFSTPLEGAVPYAYQDVLGLVSIGVGILADPIELWLPLPLVRPDGTPASRPEKEVEWRRIKELGPARDGRTAAQLGHLYARPHTTLRLNEDGLRSTLRAKMATNEATLRRGFPDLDDWPADAQLGGMSMAWAVGAGFWDASRPKSYWPKLTAALRAQDFVTAAAECFLKQEATISGLRPRNKINRILFGNAAIASDRGDDPDVLHWPADLAIHDRATEPALTPIMKANPVAPVVDWDIVHASPFDNE